MPAPLPVAAGPAPEDFPEPFYRNALAHGDAVYSVDATASRLLLRVYRDGSLARLGHDHVFSSSDLHGFALFASDVGVSRADLYVPLSSLTVDDPDLRREAGFTGNVTAPQVEGTRRNMLGPVLDSARFPFVEVQVKCATRSSPCVELQGSILLHGQRRDMEIKLDRSMVSTAGFDASGCFQIRQSDFGITPLAVLNGALKVRDEIDACFHVKGNRITQ